MEATLERVPRIRCPVRFWKSENDTQALLNLASEVNAMNPIVKLGFLVRKTEIGAQKVNGSCTTSVHPPTDVGAQKFDGTTLDIYGVVVAAFSLTDKTNRVRFFEKTFLVANINPKIVYDMFFLTLSGADVDSYTLNGVRA